MGGGIVVVLDREFLVWFTRNLEWSEISCIFHHPQNGSFRSHQILKVNCQRTCLMSFSSENREKTLRFVLTFHGQATDKLPTGYRHITNSRPTVGRQVAYISGKTCRPSVGRLSADCRPTGFFGELFFTITLKSGGLGSFSSFCKAVYTAASVEKSVNSSIEPETHHCA